MPIRYYICQVIGNGAGDSYRANVTNYPTIETSAAIDINTRTWCLVRVKANDFTQIDTDPQCVDILEGISDASNANTRQELAEWLKLKKAGEYPTAVIARITGRLNSVAVSTVNITDQTSLWEIVERPYRVFSPSGRMENM